MVLRYNGYIDLLFYFIFVSWPNFANLKGQQYQYKKNQLYQFKNIYHQFFTTN